MKLKVRSLGKIESADIDIRPITLLVGENNTNKTWTAYVAYALMKSLTGRLYLFDDRLPLINADGLDDCIERESRRAAERIEPSPVGATVELDFQRSALIKGLRGDIEVLVDSGNIADVLAAPYELTSSSSVSLLVSKGDLEKGSEYFFISSEPDRGYAAWGESEEPPYPGVSGLQGPGDPRFAEIAEQKRLRRLGTRYRNKPYPLSAKEIERLLHGFVLSCVSSVVPLPAEREALVALYKAVASSWSSVAVPLPLVDFVEKIRESEIVASGVGRRWPLAAERGISDSLKVALQGVLGGDVDFRQAGDGQILTFKTSDGIALPIQASSSFVRSIAGFLVMWRSLPKRSVIVIDEPEMNAHPGAQLAITEILAALANDGNYILATTHSPYVVDQINNLMEASKASKKRQKAAAKLFELGMTESFLSPDMVSAYEISRDGKVTDIVDRKSGRISTTTFGDVSSKLENHFSDLLAMESA